jgi:hypothetical protein
MSDGGGTAREKAAPHQIQQPEIESAPGQGPGIRGMVDRINRINRI